MSAHTPGPWKVVMGPGNTSQVVAGKDHICNLTDFHYRQTPNGTRHEHTGPANARLIAAAPDLLAACKLLLESERSLGDLCVSGCRPGVNQHAQGCAVAVAFAAIAKAEGGR